jgi:hypothetical protein
MNGRQSATIFTFLGTLLGWQAALAHDWWLLAIAGLMVALGVDALISRHTRA